jgi:mRNA interferase YafO
LQYARILVTPEFRELPAWYELFVDFYNFKVCGDHPVYWGRDATLYQKPLGKVQLTDSPSILQRWLGISDPFYRTVKVSEGDHDQWLLYAFDRFTNRYLMLDVFGPNAHEHPQFKAYIRQLQDEIVQPWLVGRYDEAFEPPDDYEP